MIKRDYEIAADEFREADAAYKALEARFMDGTVLHEVIPLDGTATMDNVIDRYKQALAELKSLRDSRNTKLVSARNAMRQAVQLIENQWRGPMGKPTVIDYNGFIVSSVTRRRFDGPSLLAMAKEKGILDDLLNLKGMDKEGNEVQLIQQEWKIDYDGIKQWLLDHDMADIVIASYDEIETTPMVKGPKSMSFIGETKDGF